MSGYSNALVKQEYAMELPFLDWSTIIWYAGKQNITVPECIAKILHETINSDTFLNNLKVGVKKP